jgi:hypothetical protein
MDLLSILIQSFPSLIQIFKKGDKPTLGFKHLILKSDDHVEAFLRHDFNFLDDFTSERVYLVENGVYNFGQKYLSEKGASEQMWAMLIQPLQQ